jgi:hypothetical protein
VDFSPHRDYIPVAIDIEAPSSAARGHTLVYRVKITSLGKRDYRLEPCPDYTESVGKNETVGSYQLNCGPVGTIAAAASVTFEMHLEIPRGARTGPDFLGWTLQDGRITPNNTYVDLLIV